MARGLPFFYLLELITICSALFVWLWSSVFLDAIGCCAFDVTLLVLLFVYVENGNQSNSCSAMRAFVDGRED